MAFPFSNEQKAGEAKGTAAATGGATSAGAAHRNAAATDSASRLPKTGDDMTAGLVPYLCAAGIAALVAGLRKSRLHHH